MKSFETNYRARGVRAAVAAILGSAVLGGYAVQAMAAEDGLEEVQVTGSRITRKDLVANSPFVSVDSAALEQKAGLNIESYLNQLPEFNPAAAPTIKGGSGGNTDVQISSVNSVGIAAVSLRGFGPNRNLVLIDGRRAVPTNALMVVDINGIPSSMIKRAEIISGGASATYGADAIGGVSNFILRRDFQGLEVDAQYGTTAAGDGQEMRASALVGTKIADGRGNITMATEYYRRDAAYEKNRDFYTDSWKDPYVGGNFLGFVMGENGYNTGSTPFAVSTLDAIMANRPSGTGVVSWSAGAGNVNVGTYVKSGLAGFSGALIRFNPDGSIFLPAGNNAGSFKKSIDNYKYKLVAAYDNTLCNSTNTVTCPGGPKAIQQVTFDETEGYASAPQTRYAFMTAADFAITDHLQFNSSARFAQSQTRTFLSTTNASLGWEASIPFNPTTDSPVDPSVDYRIASNVATALAGGFANPAFKATGTAGALHPVTAQQAMLLLSRGAPGSAAQSTSWIMETYPLESFGRRATLNTNSAWQIETGLKFDVPVKDWKGEIYFSRGETSTYNVAYGNNSLARWRTVVQSNDYGRMTAFQGNGTSTPGATTLINGQKYNLVGTYPGARNFFGTTAMGCTSGFYDTIFKGDAVPSADCQYIVSAALQTRTQNQQDITEANFQGGLFNLPAGEVRTAFGFQRRRNSSQFNPDILQSTASIDDQVIGLYPTGYLDAQTSVNDYYAEALVPIAGGMKYLKKLELELGGRYSDYSAQESTTTFKVNGNLQVNDYLRFRGGFNRANRAPNLGELYLNLQQVFTGAGAYGDPCGLISNSPFGAGGAAPNVSTTPGVAAIAPGQTADGAKSAYLICRAQIGAYANTYYTSTTIAQPGSGGGGFAWVNQIGNKNLKSEIADTWTAGFVLQSPFEHALLRNMSATVDWYQIGIKDAILPYSITYAQYLCYGAVKVTNDTEALAQAQSQACQNTPRDTATGAALNTLLSYDNQATVKTSGVDFAFNWMVRPSDIGFEKVPGAFNLSLTGTWLDYYKTKQSPAKYDPVIDWKGSLGPNLTGFNAGAYSYRLFTSLGYSMPDWSVSLRWRHLPAVAVAAKATEDAIIANNAAVTGGDTTKLLLGYTPVTNEMAPAYDVIDLSAFWNINQTFSVRFGIDNVFDKDPASTGITRGYEYDQSKTAAENAARLAAVCNGAPGCINPASYSFHNSGAGTTSGGYYDVMGRRYYIGVKAKF